MERNVKFIGTVAGVVLTLVSLVGVAWATFEIRQEVSANTNWRLIQTFERLDAIRQRRQLTQIEWQTWCQAGKDLEIFKVCPKR